jgi:polysaccharide pyruvyl transferase WcaK-like protein
LGRFTQLILARDEISRKYLEELAIRTPILTVPDTAFLLPSSESEVSRYYAAVRKASLLIGLSVSFQAKNRSPKSNDYVLTMVDFVRYLIDKYAAHVVLIPNQQSGELSNDHQIALDISQKVNNVQCDVLDTSNLLAQEIKGVIGQCEAIVAARYHTIVASLSLGIPTLAIGWHHKYAGVLEIFRQEHRICNIEKLSFEDLVEKFDDLWQNREEIRQTIAAFIPHVKEQIAAGARAVRDIMSAKAK